MSELLSENECPVCGNEKSVLKLICKNCWQGMYIDPRLKEAVEVIERLGQSGQFGNGMPKAILEIYFPELKEVDDEVS